MPACLFHQTIKRSINPIKNIDHIFMCSVSNRCYKFQFQCTYLLSNALHFFSLLNYMLEWSYQFKPECIKSDLRLPILRKWTLRLWKSRRIDHIGSNQNKLELALKKEKQQLLNEILNIAFSRVFHIWLIFDK